MGYDEKVPMPRTKAQREQAAATLRAWRDRLIQVPPTSVTEECKRAEDAIRDAADLARAQREEAVRAPAPEPDPGDFPEDEPIPF